MRKSLIFFCRVSSQLSILAKVLFVGSLQNVRRPLRLPINAPVKIVPGINLALFVTYMDTHMVVSVSTSMKFAPNRGIFQFGTKGDANVSLIIW